MFTNKQQREIFANRQQRKIYTKIMNKEPNCSYKFGAHDLHTLPVAVTYDDVRLQTRHTRYLPHDVDLSTKISEHIELYHGILPASMSTISRSKMGIRTSLTGSVAIMDRLLTWKDAGAEVRKIKKYKEGVVLDPTVLSPEDRTDKVIAIDERFGYDSIPIVDEQGKYRGFITKANIGRKHLNEKIKDRMRPGFTIPYTLLDRSNYDKIHDILLDKSPDGKGVIVDSKGYFRGLAFLKDLEDASDYPNATRDGKGRLMVGMSLGAPGKGRDLYLRSKAGADEGVDFFSLDISQADSKGARKTIKYLKRKYPDKDLIVGNTDNYESTATIIAWGADGIKAGVSSGSICDTARRTGAGKPQGSAVGECVKAGEEMGIPVGADGGIRNEDDMIKAFAIGAHYVMAGRFFAGTEETPGKIETQLLPDGTYFYYKWYEGMGTEDNIIMAGGGRYYQQGVKGRQVVSHGVKTKIPVRGSVVPIIEEALLAIKDSISIYYGFNKLEDFRKANVTMVRQTNAGAKESAPHDL